MHADSRQGSRLPTADEGPEPPALARSELDQNQSLPILRGADAAL